MAGKAGLVIGCSWHPGLRAIHGPWLSNYGHAGIASSKSPWDQLPWSHGQGLGGTEPPAPPALLGTLGGLCCVLGAPESTAPEPEGPEQGSACTETCWEQLAEHR